MIKRPVEVVYFVWSWKITAPSVAALLPGTEQDCVGQGRRCVKFITYIHSVPTVRICGDISPFCKSLWRGVWWQRQLCTEAHCILSRAVTRPAPAYLPTLSSGFLVMHLNAEVIKLVAHISALFSVGLLGGRFFSPFLLIQFIISLRAIRVH